ncbi:MAG TPA: transposase [Gemmataceae bacterium]|nr:transposase [Gemmataceae bacterium]
MNTSDARQLKAEEIAESRIEIRSSGFSVPSQSGPKRYTVQLDPDSCECEDFELRGKPCKHILAVRLWLERRDLTKDEPSCEDRQPLPKPKRKTYPQDWPNYNAAQVNEQRHFLRLLADLCQHVPEPPHSCRGRKPIPLADQIFIATLKIYSTFSARRFMGCLENAVEDGYVNRTRHFNASLKALESEALTPILIDLIRASGLPLRGVESQFAIDSSGFCASRFTRWFDVKYGVTREQADWVKVHIVCGTKTHIVTAVEALEKHTADSTQLPTLVAETSRNFTIHEMSADKAYASRDNFDALAAVGGTLYAGFKKNTTGSVGGIFEKMFHYFCILRDEYLKHYHRRSNVESVFSMVKRKFGDSVRSKTDVAMKNEVLCKLLAHNLCCLIAAWYELGIEPLFSDRKPQDDEPREILRFPG